MLQEKQLSRSEKLRRIFIPVSLFKRRYFWLVMWWIVHGSIAIFVTHVLKLIIEDVQAQDIWNIITYLLLFWLLLIVYWISIFISSQYTLSAIVPLANWGIMKEYVKKFLLLSPTYVESIWSWRRINIMERWVDAWSRVLDWFGRGATKIATRVLFAILYIAFVDIKYWLVALLIVGAILFTHYKLQTYAFFHRKDRKESTISISRTLVRHIQSHVEILQANKQDNEVLQYDIYANEIYWSNIRIMRYNGWGQFFGKVLIDILRVFSILLVSYGLYWNYITIATFASFMMILALLDGTIWQASRMYIDLMRQYVHVEKLRDVFDKAPPSLAFLDWRERKQNSTRRYKLILKIYLSETDRLISKAWWMINRSRWARSFWSFFEVILSAYLISYSRT